MIRTDGRPTIAWVDLDKWANAPSNTASAVDPATTADCDGYPALAPPVGLTVECERGGRLVSDEVRRTVGLEYSPEDVAFPRIIPCCGDPGDCGECGR